MCNMVTQVTYLNLSYKFLHKLHLQEMPSQDFIGCLKESKFDADFTIYWIYYLLCRWNIVPDF